jgi:TonB-linked SusC/RagA family outer membrane protein
MKKYLVILLMLLGTTLNALAQGQLTVTGTVTDAKGEPLVGVNVTVKDNSNLGAITNVDGKYTIKAKEYQTLVFSYIGFSNVEVILKGSKNTYNIKMTEEKVNAVDEVVITGMGTRKKLTLTGAVTNVNVSDLKQYSTSNISNTLAGSVPGVIAYQSSGQPGKNTSEFWVRGISTFGASSSAYILVDGFERSDIDQLNIEDIESFTVLKDASATAIYGSKGANGVILITTKHGAAGKVNINGKFESSYNTRTITPEFVDGSTYANLINEARVTRNLGTLYQPSELALIQNNLDPDMYPNVNWSDLLLKDGAWSTRANLNISGGGNNARYYASMAYTEDQGMYKTDQTLRKKYDTNANYKRWNYRLNLDLDITPTTVVRLGVSGDLTKRNSPGLGDDKLWGQLFGYNSLYSPVQYTNGYMPTSDQARINNVGDDATAKANELNRANNYINPWVSSTQTGYNQEWNNNIQTNVTLEQNLDFITKGLRFVGRFGYDTYNYNEISHTRMPALYHADSRNTETGAILFSKIRDAVDMSQSSSNNGSRREFLDAQLHWDRTYDNAHTFGVNVKFTQDEKISTQNLGTDIKSSVSRKNMSLASQFTYNYKNRYFLDYNFGYNGSENFADGHRWGFFPAYSVGWNIGEEPFVKKNAPWVDMFKIRYSHGKVGNDKLEDYDTYPSRRFPYLYTLGTTDASYNWGSYTYTGIYYSQVASNKVTWEVSKKDDIGLDLVLFNNQFSLTADYFYEKRTGIYQERNYLPAMIGLESNPKANVGVTESRGIDGNFKIEHKFGTVNVIMRGNMTYSKNKILEIDEENNVYAYQNQVGYRVNQVRGLVALGLFKDYEDIRNSPTQQFGDVQPGDIKYKDINGDGVINSGDVCAIGATSTPNLIYGLGFTVQWKGFDFNLLFQGAGKSTFSIGGKCVYAFSEGQWGNVFKGMTDGRWISSDISGTTATENVNASYPRLSYHDASVSTAGYSNNSQNSTFWLRDGRYLRLKNLDFGYTLPKSLVVKFHLTNVRIYVSGSNLFLLSKKFDTWDPESLQSNGENYPITKSITGGVQISL